MGNIDFLEEAFAYARSGQGHSIKDIRAYMQARRFTLEQIAQLGGRALAKQLNAAISEAAARVISSLSMTLQGGFRSTDSVNHGRNEMAARKNANKATNKSKRGGAQDRARVAGGQDYEVRYEAKKTGRSTSAVKKAVKRLGNSHKKVNKALRKKTVID